MIKALMYCVQLLVKCMPLSVRKRLRAKPMLASLYTAWLCKAKLHPSVNQNIAVGNARHLFVGKKDKLYHTCMAHHQTLLDKAYMEQERLRNVDACVIVARHDISDSLAANTLNSIIHANERPTKLALIGCDSKTAKKVRKHAQRLNIALKVCSNLEQAHDYFSDMPWLFLIELGDLVHEHCFSALNRSRLDSDFIYVDTDLIDDGERFDPAFFPDWNPDLHLSTHYVKRGLLVKHTKPMLEGLFQYEFSVSGYLERLYLSDFHVQIGHIPFVLVHSQKHESEAHAALVTKDTKPVDTSELFPLQGEPKVSLIIPTYNGYEILKDCIESILDKTCYSNYDICIVNNNSDDEDTLDYLTALKQHVKITVLDYPHPFNYSAINNFAVKQVDGEIIGLINNDIEVITKDWLKKMTHHVMREDVGAVGAKLLYSNELVQHVGVVMGYGGGAGHAHKYLPKDRPGYMKRAIATQNYSAVTAACLLVKRKDFDMVGGLNETDLSVAFNDVDFCLALREKGLLNVLVAEALLFHHESISRGHEDTLEKQKRFQAEVRYLQTKWEKYIEHDPAYNPNLTLQFENFSIRNNLEHINL